MGKLLSSALKLNIQEGLLSISSAWEPVKGEGRGAPQEGLVGHAFLRGVRDTEGLSGGGRSPRLSSCSFSSAQEAIWPRAGSLWGCQRLRFTSTSPRTDGGERE